MNTTTSSAVLFTETEGPIRGELFSVERLEQHAEDLATAQAISHDEGGGNPLIPRVLENGRILLEYYRATAASIQQGGTITPAAEWLVDNFYIVEEQLREIRHDFPPGIIRSPPSPPPAPWKGILAFSAWPGHLSRTQTAVLSPNFSGDS